MQILHRQHDRSAVVLGLCLGQVADLSNRKEEVPSTKKLRQKVNILSVLKRLDELNDARVVTLRVDLSLHRCGLLLVVHRDVALAQTLKSIDLAFVLMVEHELYDAKGASAHDVGHSKIFHRDVQVLQVHPVLELLLEHADNVLEDCSIQDQANASVISGATCRSLFSKQQSAFTKVVPTAECAECEAILLDTDSSALDEKKMSSLTSLFHDNLIFPICSPFQCPNDTVDLVSIQILEQEDFRKHILDFVLMDDLAK
mmetsp:Transcript_5174/g.14550  ORF Transcript_5174/g.14550 Transcript_5174/m.14550 type:complete len:257 (+) Transcript_5174:1033-1803(+)